MKKLASLLVAGLGVAYSQSSEVTYLDATSSIQTQLNNKVGTSTTVNGHPLSGNVVVSASDLTAGTLPSGQLPAPGAATLGGVQSKDCSAGGQFLQKINTDGTETCGTPAGGGNVSGPGTVSNGYLPQWGSSNNLLTTGLAVSTAAAANTVPEAGVGGTLAVGWLPSGGSHTVNTTAPLSGGGAVALGGTLTLSCPTCLTSNAVPSVFGRTGAVTAQSGDYSAAQISGLAASATTDATNAANISSGILSAARLPAPTAVTLGGVQSKDCSAGGQFLQRINTDGSETCAVPASGNVSGPGAVTNGYIATWGSLNNLLTTGIAAPASSVVGTSDTQTLTNKTITAPSVGPGSSPLTETWTVGATGVTANTLCQTDATGAKIVASTTGVYGVCMSTVAANGTVEVARYGTVNVLTDTGGATSGDLAVIGTGTVNYAKDPGQTSSGNIAISSRVVGVFRSTVTAGNAALVELTPAHFGTQISGISIDGVSAATMAFVDATSSIQTQLNGKVGSGTTVNGHGLSSNVTVSASDLTTGTLPAAQLPTPNAAALGGVQSKDCSGAGQFVQKINADGSETCASPPVPSVFGRSGAVTAQSGDYSAAQISGLAPSATTDTTNAANISSGTLPAARLPLPAAATLGGVQSKDCSAGGQFLQKINTDGSETCATPAGGGGGGGGGLSSYSANQTLSSTDAGHLVVVTGSAAMTITLASPPPSTTWNATILCLNTNAQGCPISRNSLTINGQTTDWTGTHALLPGQSVFLSTDGTNYFARYPDTPGTGLKYVCAATGCSWTPDTSVVLTQAQGQTMAPNACTVTWSGTQGLCGGLSGMIPPPTAFVDSNGFPLAISINAATACPASAQVNVGLGYKYLLRPDGVSNTVAGDCLASVPVLASYNPAALAGAGAFVLSTLPRRTADTYRYCDIRIGDQSSSALTNAQLGPQAHICKIPAAATVVEIDVDADAGSPSVIVGRRRCTTFTAGTCSAETVTNLISGALAVSSGFEKCANTGGTTGQDTGTTCSATLQNTALNAGDWLELVSGTAGGTAKLLVAHIIYTVN